MLKSLLASQAFLLVDNEELLDEVLALCGDRFELFVVKVEISLLDLSEDLMGVRSLEWKISRNESVQENSKRPKICHLPI